MSHTNLTPFCSHHRVAKVPVRLLYNEIDWLASVSSGLLQNRLQMKFQKLSMVEPLFASWESAGSGTTPYFPYISEIRVFQDPSCWIFLVRAQGYTLECHYKKWSHETFASHWKHCPFCWPASLLWAVTQQPSLSTNMANLIWNLDASKACAPRNWRFRVTARGDLPYLGLSVLSENLEPTGIFRHSNQMNLP